MRKLCLVVSVLVMCGALCVGCGGSGGGGQSGQKPAKAFHPDKEKYDFMQYKCPVCGSEDLKENLWSEVDGEGRIYFDSQDCKQKFGKNPQKHLKDYQSVEEQMGGGTR